MTDSVLPAEGAELALAAEVLPTSGGGRAGRPAELDAMKQRVGTGQGFTYGPGLSRHPSACGECCGPTGGILGHGTLVTGSADGRRQVVVPVTPHHVTEATGRTFRALVDTATCGSPEAAAPSAG
ncbi:hypothetical protein ACFC58_42485 [Kitasatospora purpeofusca]|uniref:hypothetical protein n=1 Tax=Kitasatospora purpeofusca TaxID=67352 RepID=UPI0035D75345